MADDNRKMYLKKILDPNDPKSYVYIPVTYEIAFRDPKTSTQVHGYLINNSDTSGRAVTKKKVVNVTGTPEDLVRDEDNFIWVERIAAYGVRDRKTQGQGYGFRKFEDDSDPNKVSWPALPGELWIGKPLSGMRHVVRYCFDNQPDGVPWIDVELDDVAPVRDPKTSVQVYNFRLIHAPLGDPIDDPDDPYKPTFATADMTLPDAVGFREERFRNLDGLDFDGITPVDTPEKQEFSLVRLDPWKRIVNVNWGNAVEFETDTLEQHGTLTGNLLVGMARIKQETTTIEDFKKLTISLFFNVPPDPDPPATSFQGQSGLMQWGGRPGGDHGILSGKGFPGSSRLWLGYDPLGEDFTPGVSLLLRTGVFDVDIEPPKSWYDDHGYDPETDPQQGQATLRYAARIDLGGIVTAWRTELTVDNKFADVWHHLLISLDASGVDFTDAETSHIWNWGWEATGVPDLIEPLDDNFTLAGSSELSDHGYQPSVALTDDTLEIDTRPNPFSGGALPDPVPQMKARVRILYTASASDAIVWGGFGVTEGMTLAQTYGTFSEPFVGGSTDVPTHMLFDGKLYKGDPTDDPPIPDPENKAQVVGFDVTAYNLINDARDGFAIDGLEPLAIPRQASDVTFSAFDNAPPDDNRLRLAKVQVWFGTFVDLVANNAKNVEKFLTITTDPNTQIKYGRPAQFTSEERAFMLANNTPPELRLSPASLAFGQPTLYLDGGPKKFIKNLGDDDDFITINDIEVFSPGPKKIPVPT